MSDARPVPLLVTDSSGVRRGPVTDRKWFVYISRAWAGPRFACGRVAGGGDESRVSFNGGTEPPLVARTAARSFFSEGQKMMVAEGPHQTRRFHLEASIPVRGTVGEDGRSDQLRRHPGRATLPESEVERSEAPTELRVVTGWEQEAPQGSALPQETDVDGPQSRPRTRMSRNWIRSSSSLWSWRAKWPLRPKSCRRWARRPARPAVEVG